MRKLNNFEKLTILVAASVGAKPEDAAVDPLMVSKWVADGDEWALSWEYDYFDAEPHPSDDEVNETSDILMMYSHLQHLDASVLQEAGVTAQDLEFPGFDGNEDHHYHLAKVMIEDLGRFVTVAGGLNNSHGSVSIDEHREMLKRYRSVKKTIPEALRQALSADSLMKILGK